MGLFTSSKTTTTTLNEAITNAVIAVMKTCAATASNSMNVDIEDTDGDVNIGGAAITQTAVSSINCQQQSQVQTALKSEITNKIQAEATTSSNTWLEMPDIGSSSSTITNTANRDVANWNVSDIQGCLSNSNNNVNFTVKRTKGTVTFDQNIVQNATAKVSSCVQGSSSILQKTTDMANDIKARSASQNVLESMLSQMGSMAAAIMGIVLLLTIVAIAGAVIMMVMRQQKKSNTISYAGNFGKYDICSESSVNTFESDESIDPDVFVGSDVSREFRNMGFNP